MRRSRCGRRRRVGLGLVGRFLVDGEIFLLYRFELDHLQSRKVKCESGKVYLRVSTSQS
jgi:hypothetical protein